MDLRGKPFYLTAEEETWVYECLAAMDERTKTGQLFCVMGGDYTIDELKQLVREEGIGAVLFRPCPKSELIEKYAAIDAAAKVPLLHAANLEEGGAGGISDGTYFANQLGVAAADDEDCTRHFAEVCAAEGLGCGINWTFSPVVDIDMNFRNPITNTRTFGADVERVLRNSEIYVETVQKAGLMACCKHFPGDGVDYRDQHLHPTYNSLGADEWRGSYGRIYKSLIDGGLMSVMVGHICQPALAMEKDPGLSFADVLPASLSRELLTGVLREEFGFNGLITTDATIMGGYCQAMERRRAIPTSIAAGCDMLVFSTDIREDLAYMRQGLESGILSRERLDEAVTRVLALKARTLRSKRIPEISAQEWQRDCAEKAVTLVKDTQKLVPARGFSSVRLVVVGDEKLAGGEEIVGVASERLEALGLAVEVYDPIRDELHGSAQLPSDRLTLVIVNCPTASNQTTVRINWSRKHALDDPRFINEEKTAMISLANPYHLQDAPRVRTYINAYTPVAPALTAAIDLLFGLQEARGKSPVDAFCGLPDTHF